MTEENSIRCCLLLLTMSILLAFHQFRDAKKEKKCVREADEDNKPHNKSNRWTGGMNLQQTWNSCCYPSRNNEYLGIPQLNVDRNICVYTYGEYPSHVSTV